MIQRNVLMAVELSPEEIAFEFSNMGDDKQARFFNELARLTEKWEKPFCFQLQSLIDHPTLTKEGKAIMEAIGDYGASR